MSSEEAQHDSGVDQITDGVGRINGGEDAPQRTTEEYNQANLTLRAIVSSKEAGVIIGKAGQNVADLRDKTGVRAGVSKVVPGVHDRVLTITGALDGVASSYGLVADGLLKGAPSVGMGGVVSNGNTHRKFLSIWTMKNVLHHISRIVANLPSYPSPHFTQPDGYRHWSSRSQDQADSGCFWCPYGRSKGDAPTIDRAYRRSSGYPRGHSKGRLGNRSLLD